MAYMSDKKIRTLVIGGGGFIGLPLIRQLSGLGRKVTVLGRRNQLNITLPRDISYVQGDFSNLELIRQLLDDHDEVINLAYASKPNTSFANPIADLQDNLLATVQLFLEVASRGLKLVVISSGGTVYGQTESALLSEDDPTRPISPYGLTKLTIEHYAHLYAVTKGLKYICLRIANAYGVGQEPQTGQGFISTAIALSLQGKPLSVFGDGQIIRDYVYVDDVADAICRALINGRESQTYNIGSGMGRSINDVITTLTPIMRELGYDVVCNYLPERPFDVRRNVLSCSRAHQDFGWSINTDFIDGLRWTRDWILGSFNAR
jgi:UDP-glucose 4-epimerase